MEDKMTADAGDIGVEVVRAEATEVWSAAKVVEVEAFKAWSAAKVVEDAAAWEAARETAKIVEATELARVRWEAAKAVTDAARVRWSAVMDAKVDASTQRGCE